MLCCACRILHTQVRQLAASSVAYCKQRGGKVQKGDIVQKIARIATRGRHPQNAERDLQFTIRSYGKKIGAEIRKTSCRMWDPSENEAGHESFKGPFLL